MKIAVIGCGYVLDLYMPTLARHPILELAGVSDRNPERSRAVAKTYGLRVYPDNEAVFSDPEVQLVLNLTSIDSHAEVIRAALQAGKHVYTEKPVTEDLSETQSLFALAKMRGLHLAAAPCNLLSNTTATMRRALADGVVGDVKLVYAEFDDNPVYLMQPEGWRSRSGAPWPWKDEFEHGCTVEHAGYFMAWLVAMFGPVARVTAFSKCTTPEKSSIPLDPPDAADFSVACLDFESGITARLTMSIIAPTDTRMRIIGNRGELWTDTHRHYSNPVRLERFTQLSLNARKARAVRTSNLLQRVFGVGGRRVPIIRRPADVGVPRPAGGPAAWLRRLKQAQLGDRDWCLGPALLARAIETGGPSPLPPDFCMHVNELTMVMHRAGVDGTPIRLQTTCVPPPLEPFAAEAERRGVYPGERVLDRLAEGLIARLHRH